MNKSNMINSLKYFYKKNTLILKILLSYFIIGIVLMSVFSFILLHTYNKRSIEEVNRSSENIISQSYNTADILLTNTYYNYYQLFSDNTDKDITNALYANDLDQFSIADVSEKLNQYITTNPLITSIYVYNSKADKIIYRLSQLGGGVQNTSDFFDHDIINMAKSQDKTTTNTYFTRKVNYVVNDKKVNDNLITLIFANISENKEIEAAIVVNLNQKVLQQMVTSGEAGDLNQVFIIYQNGEVITHSDTSMINRNIGNESYIKTILKSDKTKGYFTSSINGKDSLVTYVKADRLRMIFVGVGEYNKLLSSVASMQKTILILTIVFIIMGLIVAVYFASSIYSPFRRLLRDIQNRLTNDKKNSSLDVYDYLKCTFNELADDVEKYKLDSTQLLNEKKRAVLQKIIEGEIDNKVFDINYRKECGINLNDSFFQIIILKIDSLQNVLLERWTKDENLVKFAILNIACESFKGESVSFEGVDNGNDYVTIVLNLKNNDEILANEIYEIICTVQKSIEKYLRITVTVGVGDIVEGMDLICTSFQKALAASNYRIIFGRNSRIKYEDIAKQNKNNLNEYPYILEKQIVDSVKNFNLKRVDMNLREFFGTLASYKAENIQITVVQLLVTMAKNLSSIAKTSVENGEYSIKVIFPKVQSFETLEEIREYLYSLCSNSINTRASESEKSGKIRIVNKIKDYVSDHYNDQNITTDAIADYVELSCNYVRSIFKEVSGTSLSDYITQYRMSEAQKLLIETDYPIRRIAELMGYPENSKYFYTIFKKSSGRTPEDFRNEQRSNKI